MDAGVAAAVGEVLPELLLVPLFPSLPPHAARIDKDSAADAARTAVGFTP
jgi:hypothetical protein